MRRDRVQKIGVSLMMSTQYPVIDYCIYLVALLMHVLHAQAII